MVLFNCSIFHYQTRGAKGPIKELSIFFVCGTFVFQSILTIIFVHFEDMRGPKGTQYYIFSFQIDFNAPFL